MTTARRLAASAAVAALLAGPAVAESRAAAAAVPAVATARSAILVDVRDGHVLLQKDPREQRAIASATKLMTALLTLERAKPGEVFTAPAYAALPAESKINLSPGERMQVEDLLEALLLESANDAAVTIAVGVAGSRPAFVKEMNERAAELGLADTSYANPIGLDAPSNYSSARDLARLTVRLARNRRFARIVDQPSAVLQSGARRRTIRNRNDLVGRFPFVDGVKTGHTASAGYVLVGAAHGSPGVRVISVVLGEPSEAARDADTLALLRYGLAQFRRERVLERGARVASAAVEHRDERASLVPARGVTLTLRRGERIARRVDAPNELDGPLPAGRRVGSVAIVRDGKVVRRVALVTADEVPGAGALRIVLSVLGVPLTMLLVLGMFAVAALAKHRLSTRRRGRERERAGRRGAGAK